MTQDLRHAFRALARMPVLATVIVLSLAVGIGVNTSLFAIVDAALFRPLPVSRPDRLVNVYTSQSDGDQYGTSSYPDYLDLKAQNAVFSDMLAYSLSLDAVSAGDHSRLAVGEVVSGNYFAVLGLHAQAGRLLTPDDDRPGAPRVAVISDALWIRDYASTPSLAGRTIRIHGETYDVVGVAPRGYTGAFPLLSAEVWTPMAHVADVSPGGIIDTVPSPGGTGPLDRRGYRWLFLKGRLKDDVTGEQAATNLAVVGDRLKIAYSKTNDGRRTSALPADSVRILPQADRVLVPIAIGLMVVVGLVLLTACANVASMLLARASSRQREIAIRLAIGASRGRLIQQLLTESTVLAGLGAAAGVVVATALTRAAAAMPLPIPVPLTTTIHVDGRVLFFTIVASMIAGLFAGLAPALQSTRADLVRGLKADATTAAGRRWTLRDGLVMLQVAITMILVVGAGLLTRSLLAAERLPLGFDTGRIALVSTGMDMIGYDDARSRTFYDRALTAVRALPGVEAACLVTRTPMSINYNRNTIFPPALQQPGAKGLSIDVTTVSPEYFGVIGVPILRGRNFSSADRPDSPRVAVVNEAFGRVIFPGEDPLGRHFRQTTFDGRDVEIVGVVPDYKVNTLGEGTTPYIHFAYSQAPGPDEAIMARTAGDPAPLVPQMRRALTTLEPNTVFIDSQTMATQVGVTLLPARFGAIAVGGVGLVAMLLAAIGLYGVIAYSVARRTRDIGIRMALGAGRGSVVGLVLRHGLTLSIGGALVGAGFAFVGARALSGALYGIGALDPLTWTAAFALVFAVTLLANAVPARRAALLDPTRALRAD